MKCMKKVFAAFCALSILAGCSSSTAANTTATAEAVATVEVTDQAIADYLAANTEDLKVSYRQGTKMTKWVSMTHDSEAVTGIINAFNTTAKEFFTTTELTPVDEESLNADLLMFEIQPKTGEIIYFYSDGYLKTVSGADRNFYQLAETTIIDGAEQLAQALIDNQ